MQAESKLQARQVSAWQELPNELLYKVCQQLELKDLLAAHACCSDWYHMLRHPKVRNFSRGYAVSCLVFVDTNICGWSPCKLLAFLRQ